MPIAAGGFFAGRANRARPPARAPCQNHLLAALPRKDYERLLPDLEYFALPQGWAVHGPGEREKYLYFPTEGLVSRSYITQSGATTEFAITGVDGVIGVSLFLGGESMPSQAVVLSAGHSYRLRSDQVKDEFEHGGRLPWLLLRYTSALIAQTGQIAACNRHHSVDQRLARWLLAGLDRMPSNRLEITHQLIAESLGVRRESVTEAAGKLQKSGAIHYSRGHLHVLDRPRLESQACECYSVVKREYDRLFPDQAPAEVAALH